MDWDYILDIVNAGITMLLTLVTLLTGWGTFIILKKLNELTLRIEWLTSSTRKEILCAIPEKRKRGRPKRKNPA